MRLGGLRGGDDLFEGRVGASKPDVLRHRGREEERVLQHYSDLVSEVLHLVVSEVTIIQRDRAFRGVEEPEQEVGDRALTRAGASHHSEACPRLDLKGDPLQHWVPLLVFKVDITKGYPPGRPRKRKGIRSLRDIVLPVHYGEEPFHSCKRLLHADNLLPYRLYG